MVIVDCQGLVESVVIRESKELVDILDNQASKAIVGIRAYLDSLVKVDTPVSKVFQVTLDTRVSRGILESREFRDILDSLVYLDIQGLKASVVIQESWVRPDTVGLMVSVDTQEVRD